MGGGFFPGIVVGVLDAHPAVEAFLAQDAQIAPEVQAPGGESESRLLDFEELIVVGGLDWVQADPGRCGISTMVDIGRLAARHQRGFVNHTFKTGVSIAASLHVLAAVPNTQVLEYAMTESPIRHELDAGWVGPSDAPGLGVTINEATLERYGVA